MMKKICIGLVAFFLAACLRLEDPGAANTPTATLTATPPPTSTPTVIWFPPTETPVVTPTLEITPTPGVMVELGDVLYEDQFNSPEGWSLPQTERGQINIGNGEINIIINEPGTYFAGTREKPDLGDFYAEITANPVLCSSRDEYGFLFSVIGSGQYYRFALSCSGEVRLDRYVSGVATILYPWTRSASVPVGAPSVTKLAVLVVNDEIHIYINGISQFSTEVQQRAYGSFGVFARSVGDTALTVSFSNLIVREVLPK
jgi:hypothetical protein